MRRLKEARLSRGLTQNQLAGAAGISTSYYCQLERGARRMPLPLAQKIALALGLSLDDLFFTPGNFAECKVARPLPGAPSSSPSGAPASPRRPPSDPPKRPQKKKDQKKKETKTKRKGDGRK